MRSWSYEIAVELILKIFKPLDPVCLNLMLNLLNYGIMGTSSDDLFELFFLELFERILIEWPSSQLCHLSMSLTNGLLTLLTDGGLTTKVVTKISKVHARAIVLISRQAFLDVVPA